MYTELDEKLGVVYFGDFLLWWDSDPLTRGKAVTLPLFSTVGSEWNRSDRATVPYEQ
uniref:Uncharacterized protein n=1 Tax=Arundo donax TaxID=35708 RepID=A0A0A9BJY7_ARUDO